jgi:hypothetical protein
MKPEIKNKKEIKEIKEKIWFDLAIQCHLLQKNYRNLCQLQIYDDIVDPGFITILDSLIEYGIKYLIVDDLVEERKTRYILYNDTFNIHLLDTTYGFLFAQQLGDFYFYASSSPMRKGNIRIVLLVSKNGKDDYGEVEVYAQMCNKAKVIKYMPFFIEKKNELASVLGDGFKVKLILE